MTTATDWELACKWLACLFKSSIESNEAAEAEECAVAQLQAAGRPVQEDFCPPTPFSGFMFQFDRESIAKQPISSSELEQWVWMFDRWAIAHLADMSKGTDFVSADQVSGQLTLFAKELARCLSMTFLQKLRQDFAQPLLRFSTILARFVAETVEEDLRTPDLRELHDQMKILG